VWNGQNYSKERFVARISCQSHVVDGKIFIEKVFPVDRADEYFDHFPVLEINHVFCGLPLQKDGQPTRNYHLH